MKKNSKCPNLNHGRMNVPIRFCPNCGDDLNLSLLGTCSDELHASRRRNRNTFCTDCGKRIAGTPAK